MTATRTRKSTAKTEAPVAEVEVTIVETPAPAPVFTPTVKPTVENSIAIIGDDSRKAHAFRLFTAELAEFHGYTVSTDPVFEGKVTFSHANGTKLLVTYSAQDYVRQVDDLVSGQTLVRSGHGEKWKKLNAELIARASA